MAVDFDAVRRNANEQGVPLAEIAIIYGDLTPDEIAMLKQEQLLTHQTDSTLLGRFMADGRVMFPEKAIGVYSLGA
jgi:hypothetical protein